MSKGKIYLRPLHGLCNRVQAIVAGVALAREVNSGLVILWEVDEAVGCRLEDLFEINTDGVDIKVINLDPASGLFGKLKKIAWVEVDKIWKYLPVKWVSRAYLKRKFGDAIFELLNRDHVAKDGFVAGIAGKSIYATSWDLFYKNDRDDFWIMNPYADVLAEAKGISDNFGPDTVGVHIRRRDHKTSIRYSPINAFIREMEQCVAKNGETNFFLSTDCPKTERVLLRRFAGRIATRPRELERASQSGMQNALVDLMILARTSQIIGSFGSSFTFTAASYGGIPLTVATSVRARSSRSADAGFRYL